MDRPSVEILARRAHRRTQLRRRRLVAVGGMVAVVVLLVVVSAGGGGQAHRAARASGGSAGAGSVAPAGGRDVVTRAAPGAVGSAAVARLLKLGLPISCGGPRGREVAFTFDDGPGPYTYLALRKLTGARERATFFVVGRSMEQYPGYLRRELRVAGIGDHTYTHPVLVALSPAQIEWQLSATARKIQAESGGRVELFRPPYESHNATVDQIAQRLRLLQVLWNVDSRDSLGASYAQIIANVEAGLHPGAIILMHENHGQTIRALTTLLPELHRRHLRSVSVPELLASDPPSPTQVRKGVKGCTAAGTPPARSGH